MCALCRRDPCDSRCPNAPEPEPVFWCSKCGEGIYAGDQYLETEDGETICKECLEDMSAMDLLEILGMSLGEAKEDVEW